MKPFHRTVATILFVLFAANLAAQGDAQAEARLKELGAQIKRTGGAVTELRIRGAKLGAAEYRLIGGLTCAKNAESWRQGNGADRRSSGLAVRA